MIGHTRSHFTDSQKLEEMLTPHSSSFTLPESVCVCACACACACVWEREFMKHVRWHMQHLDSLASFISPEHTHTLYMSYASLSSDFHVIACSECSEKTLRHSFVMQSQTHRHRQPWAVKIFNPVINISTAALNYQGQIGWWWIISVFCPLNYNVKFV